MHVTMGFNAYFYVYNDVLNFLDLIEFYARFITDPTQTHLGSNAIKCVYSILNSLSQIPKVKVFMCT